MSIRHQSPLKKCIEEVLCWSVAWCGLCVYYGAKATAGLRLGLGTIEVSMEIEHGLLKGV